MAEIDCLANQYIAILQEELVPSFGCSDPGCIAYVAAVAAKALGVFPERMVLKLCGPLIKNATGVYVPNSGHLRGTNAAGVMGVVCGNPEKELEALAEASDADREKVRELLAKDGFCRTELAKDVPSFYAMVEVFAGDDCAKAVVVHQHNNLTHVSKNDTILFEKETTTADSGLEAIRTDRSVLTVKDIIHFAQTVELSRIQPLIDRQIDHNMQIAEDGIKKEYGPSIGQCILKRAGDDILQLAKAYAVAGADARMSGCSLSVIANSMSGNQGITVCVPVVVFARTKQLPHEQLVRALLISNLLAIRIRSTMGVIPAFCTQVNAATGSAAAIAFLSGGGETEITDTIRNSLANVSGMVCDGAKPSCAAKISSALDSALLGYDLAMQGKTLEDGTGIIKQDIEKMIVGLGKLVQQGMRETGDVILDIMVS